MPVKVDRDYILCDFIVMNMSRKSTVPIIFGRPFLATTRAEIDMGTCARIVKIGDQVMILAKPKEKERQPLGRGLCKEDIRDPREELNKEMNIFDDEKDAAR